MIIILYTRFFSKIFVRYCKTLGKQLCNSVSIKRSYNHVVAEARRVRLNKGADAEQIGRHAVRVRAAQAAGGHGRRGGRP